MKRRTTDERQRKSVQRAIERGSFCTLATSSAANRPHVVGVLYVAVQGSLVVSTLSTSVKAGNVRANPLVAVCIPVRRLPLGPPFHIALQGRAEVCERDDPRVVDLLEGGRLKPIASHGELDHPDSCFLVMSPSGRAATYGLGVPLRQIARNPLGASRSVELLPPADPAVK